MCGGGEGGVAAKILWIGLGTRPGRGRASLKGSYNTSKLKGSYITSTLLVGKENFFKNLGGHITLFKLPMRLLDMFSTALYTDRFYGN
jgi:hypothetical protein